jgi:sugar phosphate isomerase/epimerase
MRLGAPVFGEFETPEAWVETVKQHGYRAALCPVKPEADDVTVRAYEDAARKADILIAEVGAWCTPISEDPEIRKAGLDKCKAGLALADRIGARCCVNVSGTRVGRHSSPQFNNLTPETFDMVVESVRDIIDSVKPKRAYYTLETMTWMYPDSAENYLRLIEAIDRERFCAHLDPVNFISSPQRYFNTAAVIREAFRILGPYIRSCHAKDIFLHDKLTLHMDEICPGQGALDYRVYLTELNKLDRDTPLMIEHLKDDEEYIKAAEHIRSVASELKIEL